VPDDQCEFSGEGLVAGSVVAGDVLDDACAPPATMTRVAATGSRFVRRL
jgi:hypothetical protein